ncbi:PIN domain-containing protein [Candidatus Micrarchaeota archaeon]|nr:PIN domain-containing protein [Candidatus Micrarchaeota archaeon]
MIMMSLTFDTYAWMVYFLGEDQGKKVKRILEREPLVYTSALSLMEFKAKYLKQGLEYQSRLEFIKRRSQIIDVTSDIALNAAELKHRKKLHASDAIIYATAKYTQSKLLTGDAHFTGFKDVQMLYSKPRKFHDE